MQQKLTDTFLIQKFESFFREFIKLQSCWVIAWACLQVY